MLTNKKLFTCLIFLCILSGNIAARKFRKQNNVDANRTKDRTVQLRVMTFNIWQCGSNVDNGTRKIAAVIQSSGADIVGLQVKKSSCYFVFYT
jgi:hypothetical protein